MKRRRKRRRKRQSACLIDAITKAARRLQPPLHTVVIHDVILTRVFLHVDTRKTRKMKERTVIEKNEEQ